MMAVKCRNSVFCIQFLVFFLLGTICGIWFFHCLSGSNQMWIEQYCALLGRASIRDLWTTLLLWIRPLVLVWLVGFFPWGYRTLPFIIAVRGLLTAYSICAILRAGLSPGPVIVRGLLLLPLFYWLCYQSAKFE